MKIKEFQKPSEQTWSSGSYTWSIARLIKLAEDLPVMDIPLDHLNTHYSYEDLSLRDFVMHMNTVNNADLSYPIILDEDGYIMDGRHRLMKAMLTGAKTIKAVRFDENPVACRVRE